jgi:hypothetical protein
MADRLHREPVLRPPLCGQLVQRRDLPRLSAPQLQLQQPGEQVVIAEPGLRRVQRHHERARLLQILQHPLPARPSGQQVGQLAVDPVQHAGAQQQPPHLLGLPVQHLGQQVLRHRPLGAGELRREPLRIRMPGQRQRRQPQPGRPPLRPVHQQPQRRVGQPYSRRRRQLSRLGHGEPQIIGADLGQLPLQPQPVQPQPHVMPRRQHQPQLLRRAHHQQLQLPPRHVRAQLMHVIDDQPQPVRQRRQIRQQPLGDRPPIQIRRRRQLPHQPRPRDRLAQRAQHRQPEPLRIPLISPHRHPRGAPGQARLADPGPQQHRLAAARRRRHHRHPPRPSQSLPQRRTGYNSRRTRTGDAAGSGPLTPSGPHSPYSHETSVSASAGRAASKLANLAADSRSPPMPAPSPAIVCKRAPARQRHAR